MPVLIDPSSPGHHLFTRQGTKAAEATTGIVNIGLINNMPDSAMVPTERQLFDLLSSAAGKLVIKLHLYSMDTVQRTDWGRDYVSRFYRGVHELFDRSLDGIIVTGAEPNADCLTEEPYWSSFTQIVDWAKDNTFSSVCSCLAVHGLVLHLDGIERHALPEKCIGIFNQTRAMDHPLLSGVQERLRFPHSRWNEVREDDLVKSDYQIITRSADTGVDCFVRQHKRSLFVCFQGHPEYEAQTLLGEYRRDIGRFLRREHERYPTMPRGYFGRTSEQALLEFRRQALLSKRPELLASFPVDQLARELKNTWHAAAKRIFRNWILYLSSQKARRSRSQFAWRVG